MKQTPLHAQHLALGAKMMPFAGYDMPVRYAGDQAEHMAVRQAAGLFDVSHMGEFLLHGPKAAELLQRITTNDISKLAPGKAQYNCLPTPEGGIVDDLIVYQLHDELYMAVVNAANIEKDWNWMSQHNTEGVEMENISESTALLALSGPQAWPILSKLAPATVAQVPYYAHTRVDVGPAQKVLVATTGYTGERTFELYVDSSQAPALWDALLEAGQEHGIQPVGLGARDTLRLEMGYMLYGNDITVETNPLEAGLGWITKLKKGPFVGSEAIAQVKEQGLSRKLVGIRLEDKGICRAGSDLLHNGQTVGTLTSGGFSPSLQQSIGLGYVPAALAEPGTELQVQVRNRTLAAVVQRPPFVQGTSLAKWQEELKAAKQ